MSVQAPVLHGQRVGSGIRPGMARNGAAAQCLTGQIASVHEILAGLHIHTGRLGWRDFGFEFWEPQGAKLAPYLVRDGPTLSRPAQGLASLDAARRHHLRQNEVAIAQRIMASWEYKISLLVPPVSPNYLFITVNQQHSHPHSSRAVNRLPLSRRLLINTPFAT
jgi:hypothetical protein